MRLWNSPKSGKFQYEGMRKGVSGDNWFFTQQRDNATLVDTVDPLLRSKKEIIRRSSRVQGSAKRCFLGCKQTATLFFCRSLYIHRCSLVGSPIIFTPQRCRKCSDNDCASICSRVAALTLKLDRKSKCRNSL